MATSKIARHRAAAYSAVLCGALAALAANAAAPAPSFAVLDRIAGPDGGGWDYATIDAAKRRLYLARRAGVLEMDLETRKITPVAIAGDNVHTAAIVGDTGLLVVTNGGRNTAAIFDTKSNEVKKSIPVGASPDAALYDPATKLVAVMNHRGGTVSVVDAAAAAVVRTIKVGGELEFAAPDGTGRLFVNVADKAEIAVLDLRAGTVLKRYKLAGCEDASGLAYDADDKLVASVCGNGVTKVLNADTGADVATLKTGKGSDALIFDAARKLLFVPAGEDGTLTVVALGGGRAPTVLQTLTTERSARLGQLDPKTGRLYLPFAKEGPPVPPSKFPSPVKGGFGLLVVGTR